MTTSAQGGGMHPFVYLPVPPKSIAIHWFEQNAYALKGANGKIMLVDPYFPHERPPERFIRPTPPVDEATLPVSYVAVTHAHGDHTNPETITRIRKAWPEVVIIGPPESIAQVREQTPVDAEHTHVIKAGESVVLDGFKLHAIYGKPVDGDPQAGIQPPRVTHLSLVIELDSIRVYISGDVIHNFAERVDLVEPVRALKPDIGMLTTHPTEGEFPFFEGSVAMAQHIGLKTVVPSHYECFAKRTYDPHVWAAMFPPGGPEPLIIPWNSHVLYTLKRNE
jgi:L-ascorbate metabolism protein UlaG (beta-lactamase superfamily)